MSLILFNAVHCFSLGTKYLGLIKWFIILIQIILYSLLRSPFWEHIKEILNPETSIGAEPWVYYSIYAFFVFVFNIFDIVSIFLNLL